MTTLTFLLLIEHKQFEEFANLLVFARKAGGLLGGQKRATDWTCIYSLKERTRSIFLIFWDLLLRYYTHNGSLMTSANICYFR